MAEPGNYDIVLHRNVTKIINFNLKNGDGSAFDLTDYTVTADAVGAILPDGRLELDPSITDDVGGVITITLVKAVTGGLVSTDGSSPGEVPLWDMLIDDSGVTSKILIGKVFIKQTQTT